jgi:RNA polymerase sigma-70 factor (ECF subfamily)
MAPLESSRRITRVSQTSALDSFLAGVQRRAWLHARLAVRDDDAAFDIVQDAMIRLVEHYADRPAGEWPLLFQRILQNAILDHFRRRKVRDHWVVRVASLLSGGRDAEDAEEDAAERLLERIASADSHVASAEDEVAQRETLAQIADALEKLPARQREAFLLRYWEGYDLAETAKAMACSEGSVKTHCSRACRALAQDLAARGVSRPWMLGLDASTGERAEQAQADQARADQVEERDE